MPWLGRSLLVGAVMTRNSSDIVQNIPGGNLNLYEVRIMSPSTQYRSCLAYRLVLASGNKFGSFPALHVDVDDRGLNPTRSG